MNQQSPSIVQKIITTLGGGNRRILQKCSCSPREIDTGENMASCFWLPELKGMLKKKKKLGEDLGKTDWGIWKIQPFRDDLDCSIGSLSERRRQAKRVFIVSAEQEVGLP